MTTYSFNIRRSGDLAVPCTVAWALQGTGLNPITGASFSGGVLPSGTVAFAAAETVKPAGFELTATARPLLEQTGQIQLRDPFGCKIAPAGESHALTIKGSDAPPPEEWDFAAVNIVVHGQSSRVTFSAPGGVPQVAVAGAANSDGNNVVLWFKPLPFLNYEMIFEYQKNEDDPPADATGRFAQFWGAMLGTTKPTDVTTWSAAQWGTAADADYSAGAKSWRINFDMESTNSDSSNEATLAIFTEGVTQQPTALSPNFWLEGAESKTRIVVRRQDDTVTLTHTGPDQEAVQWTHADASRAGRIGFGFARGRGGILRHHPDGSAFIRDLGTGGGGTFPYGPWRTWQRPSSGSNVYRVSNADDLRTRITNAQSGDYILLPAGGNISLGGDLIITRAVSGENAYYIGTDTDSDDPANYCMLNGGDIIHDGARRCVIHGIRQDGGEGMRPKAATLCQWECIKVTGYNNNSSSNKPYDWPEWFMITADGVENCLLGFVQYQQCTASFYGQKASGNNPRNPKQLLITHIDNDRPGGASKFLQPGYNPIQGTLDAQSRVQYCLDRGSTRLNDVGGSSIDWCEFKTNGWHIFNNTIEDDAVCKAPRCGRLGREGDGGTGPKRGMIFEANVWVTNSVRIETRGAYHLFLNNWCIAPGGSGISLASKLGTANLQLAWGASNGRLHPPSTTPAGTNQICTNRESAYGIRAGGNRGFSIKAGGQDCTAQVPNGHKPTDCILTESGQGRNTKIDKGNIVTSDYTTQLGGADIDKVPRRMQPADVGPAGWRKEFAP